MGIIKCLLEKKKQRSEELFMDVKMKEFRDLDGLNYFIITRGRDNECEKIRFRPRIKPINVQYIPPDDIDFDEAKYILFYYEEHL